MKCPHCKSKTTIRTSEELSPITRKQYRQCTNIYCCHSFVVLQSVSLTIVPSAIPDPTVKIPLSSKSHAA
ncbi:ogr/Delta-like zinc finger family protein [Gilliamella sp. W8136]|uniref:Ogr/Delta-like zinc finger family protein n=1 Tax=Gilliamella apicola TaxID=1196095 RepID=A0A556S943_9GAMM|nr:ogr/Delta-like zinc finger family protein [Gilliamella sp. W8136]TSJ97656.1 ogr/Delta-like zinc finger family protein [Gilliamella apicola]